MLCQGKRAHLQFCARLDLLTPFPLTPALSFAERFLPTRIRPLNHRTAAIETPLVRSGQFIARATQPEHISLSSSGGEGWGEEAVFSYAVGSWGEGAAVPLPSRATTGG